MLSPKKENSGDLFNDTLLNFGLCVTHVHNDLSKCTQYSEFTELIP